MAIVLTDIINGSVVKNEWIGTGVFDKLLYAVNKNLEIQHELGRITGSEFASAYTANMQAVLNQSVEYIMKKDLIDAQILDATKGTELKESQLLTEAKQRESIDIENTIKQAQNTKDLELKDKQILEVTSSVDLKNQQKTSMVLEDTLKTNDSVSTIALKNAQKDEVVKSGTRSDSELADKLSTSAKQRVILDKESLLKDNQISIAYAEYVGKDKQVALMGLDNVVKIKEASRISTPTYVYSPSYIKQ